jgi:hypothetical protein
MPPELTFHQTGSAFFWAGFLLVTAAGSCALLLGLLLLLQSSTPDLLGRATATLRERPVLAPAIGLGITVGLAILAAVGKGTPPVGAVAVAVFAALGLFGLAATAENLGRRIAWLGGREGTRLSNLVTGWLVFFAAACVPWLGWFLILPWGLTSGLGALVLGARYRQPE